MDARYYFHLKAANGQVVLQSQGYSTRASANNGVTSVKTNALNRGRYEVREAKDGKQYFVLKASNGRTIGISEMYETVQGAQSGIASVMNSVSVLVNGK
ncbi:MAG: YegP family protein [Myxococcales bacterium]|nr:YegP family protein [Myxococcales bacterium]